MLWKNNEDIDHYQVLLFTSKDDTGLVAEHFTGKSDLTRRLYHRRAVLLATGLRTAAISFHNFDTGPPPSYNALIGLPLTIRSDECSPALGVRLLLTRAESFLFS